MSIIDSASLAMFRTAQAGSAIEDAFEIKIKVDPDECAHMVLKTGGIPFFESSRENDCDTKNGEIIVLCCGEAAEQMGHVPLIREIKVLRQGKELIDEHNQKLGLLKNALEKETKGSAPLSSSAFPYNLAGQVHGLKKILARNINTVDNFRLNF